MKTITMTLDTKSIDSAIKQLEAYRDDLQRKVEYFNTRLGNIGLSVIQSVLVTLPDDLIRDTDVFLSTDSDGVYISMTGEQVLFIEFGAGIKYSNPQHPQASEFGYGVGTYPNQKHAFDPNGWWYKNENGESVHSYGNKPYMPMFKASQEMRMEILKIAKEVFK